MSVRILEIMCSGSHHDLNGSIKYLLLLYGPWQAEIYYKYNKFFSLSLLRTKALKQDII